MESSVNLDIEFAQKFTAQSGKFVYCENTQQFFAMLSSLKSESKWNFIYTWAQPLRDMMARNDFQLDQDPLLMEQSEAAISFCDSLVADSGVIMLSPDQATNRRLTTFPGHHIIVANRKSMVPEIETALARFKNSYFNKLPSIIELNPEKKVYKDNHSRLLNAEGTRDIYIFYIDQDNFG